MIPTAATNLENETSDSTCEYGNNRSPEHGSSTNVRNIITPGDGNYSVIIIQLSNWNSKLKKYKHKEDCEQAVRTGVHSFHTRLCILTFWMLSAAPTKFDEDVNNMKYNFECNVCAVCLWIISRCFNSFNITVNI